MTWPPLMVPPAGPAELPPGPVQTLFTVLFPLNWDPLWLMVTVPVAWQEVCNCVLLMFALYVTSRRYWPAWTVRCYYHRTRRGAVRTREGKTRGTHKGVLAVGEYLRS